MAWDRYAVAAAISEQMPFAVAMLHKKMVLNVAVDAGNEDKTSLLGVLFDEVSR